MNLHPWLADRLAWLRAPWTKHSDLEAHVWRAHGRLDTVEQRVDQLEGSPPDGQRGSD